MKKGTNPAAEAGLRRGVKARPSGDSTRKREEEALQREFAMCSALLENLPCIAMILRKGTREIVFENEAARRVGGGPGKTCYGTCAQRSDPCPFCLAPEVWTTNEPRQLEVEYRGKYYQGRWVPLTDSLYAHYIFDITERKRAEEEILNVAGFPSENPNPVLRIARDGTLLYSNEAGLSLLPQWHLQVGQAAPLVLREAVFQSFDNGSTQMLDLAQGERVYSFFVTPIPEAGYANLYGRDVTEQKRAGEALRESEAKLKAIFEVLPVGVAILDGERQISYMNAALERILGTSREYLLKGIHKSRTYLRPDGTPMPAEEFASARALKEQRAVHKVETGVVKEDGGVIWTSVSAVPVAFSDWKVVVVTADITERKGAEEALRYERDFAEGLIETAQTIVLVLDTQGRIVRFNPYMEQLSGYALAEVQGNDWFTTFLPERDREQTRRLFLNAIRGIQSHGNLNSIVTKDGRECEIEWYDKTLKDAQGNVVGLLATGQDVTEHRRAEEQRRVEQERLRALASQLSIAEERERRRLAATLHEQVGQLLALSRLKLAALREEAGAAGLARPVDEVKAMVDEALATTRSLTSELAPPVLYRFGLEAAIEWYGDHLKEQTGFAVDCAERGTPRPLDDDVRGFLFAAVRELLLNVVKHAHTMGARVLLDWRGEVLVLTVEDDGAGFEPEAGNGGSDNRGCFGLFSIHERARDLGGRLEVDSAPGKGTRVKLAVRATGSGKWAKVT